MSHFVFGSIQRSELGEPGDAHDEFAWQLVRTAFDAHVFALVGANVTQRPVLDVLREHGLLGHNDVPFLLTASPARDTSDELISPYQESEPDSHGILESLRHIGDWLGRISGLPTVGSIHLFTSEGYDVVFAESSSPPSSIAKLLMHRIEDAGEVPSMWIRVTQTP